MKKNIHFGGKHPIFGTTHIIPSKNLQFFAFAVSRVDPKHWGPGDVC